MAKFYGKIGYFTTTETKPGVWTKQVIEKNYYGDVIRDSRRLQSNENLNDNITISNQISIIADPFATQNFHSMLYVEYMGAKWKITNVDVNYPHLTLSIGDLYNEEET